MMNVASSPTNAVAFSFFVAPMTEDLGWSRGAMGWALLARLGVAGITSPLMGVAVDRVGARVLGTIAALAAGLCTIALALVHDVWLFYALFAISGLSGFGGPAGQLLTVVPVAKWFVAHRGRALAIATIGMPLGTAIYIPVIQAIIDGEGWRTAWVVSGLLVLLLAVPACALLMRKDPESIGLHPDGRDTPIPLAAADAEYDVDWTVGQVLRSRAFWTILLATGLSGVVIPGTLVYRTPFWEDTGLSSNLVAIGTAIDPLTVVFSGLFFGFLAERVASRHLGLLGGAGVALSMVPMVLATGHAWTLFAHNLLWGFSMGANITVNNLIWPEYFGRKFLGTIRGIVFPIGVGTAAISTPIFAVLLTTAPEDRYVWLVTLAAYLAYGVLIFASRRPRRPVSATQPAAQPTVPELVAGGG
jgi:sugar phosphate permease